MDLIVVVIICRWFGPHAAHGTVYVPILSGMTTVPSCLQGWQGVMDFTKSFWAFRAVENLAQIKFSFIIQNIRSAQDQLEGDSQELVNQLSTDYVAGKVTFEEVTQKIVANAEKARTTFVNLFYQLLFTYSDGWINTWSDGRFTSKNAGMRSS